MADLSNQASFDQTLLIETALFCSVQFIVLTTQQTVQKASSLRGISLVCAGEKTEGIKLTSAIRYCDSLYKCFIPFFRSASVILHDKLTLGKEIVSETLTAESGK